MKHTPTPWRIEQHPNPKMGFGIYGNERSPISAVYLFPSGETEICNYLTEANAELIVRAVNAHDDLVAALEKLTKIWSDYSSQEMYGEHLRAGIEEIDFDAWTDAHDKARAALEKAARGK